MKQTKTKKELYKQDDGEKYAVWRERTKRNENPKQKVDESQEGWLLRTETVYPAIYGEEEFVVPAPSIYANSAMGYHSEYRSEIVHTVYGFLTFIERYILERQEAGEVEELDKKPESEQKELLRDYGYTGSGPFQSMSKSLRRSFGNTSKKSINTDAFRNARIKYLLDLKIKELKEHSKTFTKLFTLYDKINGKDGNIISILKTPELKELIDNETRYPFKFIYSYINKLPKSNTKRDFMEKELFKHRPDSMVIGNTITYDSSKVIDDTITFDAELINLFPTPGNARANATANPNAAAGANTGANTGANAAGANANTGRAVANVAAVNANAERVNVPLLPKGGMRKNKVKKTRKNKEKKTVKTVKKAVKKTRRN